MSKFCIKCGNRCVDHAEYCPRCGTAFVANPVPPTPIQPTPTPMQPMPKLQHSQSALLGKVQMFWNRLQSDRQFLRKVVIATVTVVVCLVLALVLIQRMNSVDGTWVSDDGSRQLVIHGNIVEDYWTGEDGDFERNEPEGWEKIPDKQLDRTQHIIYLLEDGVYEGWWYRRKGKTLYLHASRQSYDANQPDEIFYRK